MYKNTGDNNIKVFIRVRPFQQKQNNTQTIIQSLNQKSITIKDKQYQNQFTFDQIFNENSTQQQVYQKVGQDVVQLAFEGINGTIFAYGQTSSGKTHTCIGPDSQNQNQKGILPRLVSHIFNKITQFPPYIQFRIKISMIQIYLQKIRDLFDPTKTQLKIRQNKSKGIYIQNLTQQYVASTNQAINLLKKGIQGRTVANTNMNDVSSRSHMAFLITLYQNNLKDASAKSGKIILVDLAGSQKVGKTLAQGKVLEQAKYISKSLSALGNVINALTDMRTTHVPYRDSTLTRLLQQSLGGNSKTRLIINISPSSYNYSQSLTSLRFGFRAKQIRNKPKVNRQYTVAQLLILLEKAQKRIEQLQKILSEYTSSQKRKSNKSKGPVFVQNLLDSDNPILQGASESQQEYLKTRHKSVIKEFQMQSQITSDQDQQLQFHKIKIIDNKLQKSISQPSKYLSFQQFTKYNEKWNEQKNQLLQMIRDFTLQKNQNYRQIQILEQKYEIAAKQARLISSKYNSIQKQNEKLLQKMISIKIYSQQKQSTIKQLEQQLKSYQQSIKQIINTQNKINKVFGNINNNNSLKNCQQTQTTKLIDKYKKYQQINQKQQQHTNKTQIKIDKNYQQQNQQLKKKIKKLQIQLSTFKGLQQTKQSLIKQKLQFITQKGRIYKDLQNRIQKVLQLEQLLDQYKQKNKSLQQIINSQQSQKGRKIILLQKHIDQISQNYYVIKGQQSSWINNNKKYQQKLQQSKEKIKQLQSQIIDLKIEIETLKINQIQKEQNINQQQNIDFDVYDYENNNIDKNSAKIVKVLTSSNIFSK